VFGALPHSYSLGLLLKKNLQRGVIPRLTAWWDHDAFAGSSEGGKTEKREVTSLRYSIVESEDGLKSRRFWSTLKLFGQLRAENGETLRLLSPYKEHLSQSFARFFMRVGLPIDIDPFL